MNWKSYARHETKVNKAARVTKRWFLIGAEPGLDANVAPEEAAAQAHEQWEFKMG